MIESIEKLRDLLKGCGCSDQCYSCGINFHGSIADEIEAEIAERYMLLPVDADGVPIRVGDVMKLKQCGERIGTVTAVGKRVEARAWVLPDGKNVSVSYIASGIKHVKQRPIEDVLREFVGDYEYSSGPDYDERCIAKYAAEIRELMEVDA